MERSFKCRVCQSLALRAVQLCSSQISLHNCSTLIIIILKYLAIATHDLFRIAHITKNNFFFSPSFPPLLSETNPVLYFRQGCNHPHVFRSLLCTVTSFPSSPAASTIKTQVDVAPFLKTSPELQDSLPGQEIITLAPALQPWADSGKAGGLLWLSSSWFSGRFGFLEPWQHPVCAWLNRSGSCLCGVLWLVPGSGLRSRCCW